MTWTAEITNDPKNDYNLYIELLENDEYRGRIERDESGALILTFYSADVRAPVAWLSPILARAEDDLAERSGGTR